MCDDGAGAGSPTFGARAVALAGGRLVEGGVAVVEGAAREAAAASNGATTDKITFALVDENVKLTLKDLPDRL